MNTEQVMEINMLSSIKAHQNLSRTEHVLSIFTVSLSKMDSQDLKQRVRDEPADAATTTATATATDDSNSKTKRLDKKAMAKRGLKSLALFLIVPILLILASSYLFGSRHSRVKLDKPFSLPLWTLHLISYAASILMGLSAWLFWVDGGFHKKPGACYLYTSWLVLMTAWEPIVLGMGASRIGLLVCAGMIGAQVGCSRIFQEVNSVAGDLVKPCLGLLGFLALVNFKLAFL